MILAEELRSTDQVKNYKYLGSWITEDLRCEKELTVRIAMAKSAFWQNKEFLRRNIRMRTKMKILDCYIFSIFNSGCDSWIWIKALQKKINAFEMWCYRRMMKISWKDKISNTEVLEKAQTELHFLNDMKRRKLEYAGHVMRGSSGVTHLEVLEGKIEGKRGRGRPRLTWMDDIIEWTELNSYGVVKRTAEDRVKWKTIVVNLLKQKKTLD